MSHNLSSVQKKRLYKTLMYSSLAAAFAPLSLNCFAQAVTTVTVSANPLAKEENMQILSPTKILSGTELRSKVGSSLGETLGSELGVTASGFGAGASRPIIRGLEGPRVKILQNGMGVADVSGLSNDHAVASESASSQQIEILRGPSALLYGSGAIGGLVNVVDGRIPTTLNKQVSGEVEAKYGTVNGEKSLSFFLDGAQGDFALHADGNSRNTSDYAIPGYADVRGVGVKDRLPSSFTHEHSMGVGASYIQSWGYAGLAVQDMRDRYGIPTEEHSYIEMQQTRLDFDSLVRKPFAFFDSLTFKLASTDYAHTEKESNGVAATKFLNKTNEARVNLSHNTWNGWEGSWGVQTENTHFSALSAQTGRADTIPNTMSVSRALFLLEQKSFGDFIATAGARLESVERTPDAQANLLSRRFTLDSASIGAMWNLGNGMAIVSSLSSAQRAPATEELYSHGPHESTRTFDIGDAHLKKESSENIEFALQKTSGLVQWKFNLFENRVNNYVYGEILGIHMNAEGEVETTGEFQQRLWKQAAATVRGGEAEISYNALGEGYSVRGFADTSHASLNQQGNLPLQPATRLGIDLGYRHAGWRNSLNIVHARRQDRLAAFETYVTPAYTKVDANLTYTHPYLSSQLTWFLQVKNLLNQEIRLATAVLKETVPQAKRGWIMGVRCNF